MTWEKFKALSFRKKVEHIWEYYRWHILITVIVVLCLGTWIHGIVTNRDPYLQFEMLNCYGASDGAEAFDEFLTEQGKDLYEDDIVLGKNIQLDSQDPQAVFGAMQMLMCTVAAGEPDLIFWDSNEILPALDGGTMLDLREVFPQEFLDRYPDSLVYGENVETGEKYPCGIYTERNPWIMEHKYYVNCTAGISVTCKDRDLAGAFIEYMLEYES